jgi:hypothetical protein
LTDKPNKTDTRNRFAPFVSRIVEAYRQHVRPMPNPKAEYGYIVAALKRIAAMRPEEESPEDRMEYAAALICDCLAAYPSDWHRQDPDRRFKRIGLLMSANELDNKLVPIAIGHRRKRADTENPWKVQADRLGQTDVAHICSEHANRGGTPQTFRGNYPRGPIADLLKRRDEILAGGDDTADRLNELSENAARIWIGHPTLAGNANHAMRRLAAALAAIHLGFGREGQ